MRARVTVFPWLSEQDAQAIVAAMLTVSRLIWNKHDVWYLAYRYPEKIGTSHAADVAYDMMKELKERWDLESSSAAEPTPPTEHTKPDPR